MPMRRRMGRSALQRPRSSAHTGRLHVFARQMQRRKGCSASHVCYGRPALHAACMVL